MNYLWENKTGLKQITLRYLSFNNGIGTAFRVFVSYIKNNNICSSEFKGVYVSGLMPNSFECTIDADAIVNFTTEKIIATGTKYLTPVLFQIGTGTAKDFILLDSLGTFALNTEQGDIKSTKTQFVSSFEDLAITPGTMTVSGGTYAIFFGDVLFSDVVKSVSGVLTVSGATTGAKLVLLKNYSGGYGTPVAIANYTTTGAETIRFNFSVDCVAEQRATNYLLAPMAKLYFYDLPMSRLIYIDPGSVSQLTSAECMCLANQTLRVS